MAAIIRFILLGVIVLFLCSFMNKLSSINDKANELYQEGKYQEALELYRDVQVDNPSNSSLRYNVGNVLYQKNNYYESIGEYKKALNNDELDSSEEAIFSSQILYNLGNRPQ